MAFIIGCFMIALMIKGAWDFVRYPAKRGEIIREFLSKPLGSLFIVVWMTFFLMFFLGVFIRPIGDIAITSDGWQVWEIGILGLFGMWGLTFIFDPNKLDGDKD